MSRISIPTKELKKAINKISFAVLKDTENEYYKYFSDICFYVLPVGIDFVASNSRLIAVYFIEVKTPIGLRGRFSLSKEMVEFVLNLSDEGEVEFKFDLENVKLTLQSKSHFITSDLFRCRFPDYRDVMLDEDNSNFLAIVDRELFYQSVKNGGEVELFYSKANVKKFEGLELFVNSLYLQKILENLSEYERVRLNFLGNVHQFSIHTSGWKEVYIMLPEKELTQDCKRMIVDKDKIFIK